MQLIHNEDGDDWFVHTRWGRVGVFGQVKTVTFGATFEAALKEFDKKFKDKSGHKWGDRGEPAKKNKYTFIERSYESDDDDERPTKQEDVEDADEKIESKLPKETQRLIELIFNQKHFNSVLEGIGYNADKLPLGKLSKATLKKGFDHLNELAALIKNPALAGNKYQCSQQEVSRSSLLIPERPVVYA